MREKRDKMKQTSSKEYYNQNNKIGNTVSNENGGEHTKRNKSISEINKVIGGYSSHQKNYSGKDFGLVKNPYSINSQQSISNLFCV